MRPLACITWSCCPPRACPACPRSSPSSRAASAFPGCFRLGPASHSRIGIGFDAPHSTLARLLVASSFRPSASGAAPIKPVRCRLRRAPLSYQPVSQSGSGPLCDPEAHTLLCFSIRLHPATSSVPILRLPHWRRATIGHHRPHFPLFAPYKTPYLLSTPAPISQLQLCPQISPCPHAVHAMHVMRICKPHVNCNTPSQPGLWS